MSETKLGQTGADIASMIRVNQAGEYGAAQIYKGQLAVMGDDAPQSSEIHHALGATTAALGPRAAMACTAAVETEIDQHYQEQLDALEAESEPELTRMIAEFREEELEHKATAIASGAEDAPGYPVLSAAIRLGCRVAIGLSKRI
jgi:ubiquinone biosynthesis monooxygenase Coq7